MKLKILFTILISPFFALAQNLVPNPSLERGCPLDLTYLSASVPWDNPTLASPDYFNVCSFSPRSSVPTNDFGYQNARTGDGYAGFYADQLTTPFYLWREYLQVQLTSPLQAGETYDVQFYWNLANASSRYVEELGAYFSTTQVNGFYDGNIPVSPQVESSGVPLNDTTNWVAFNGSFVASGGEEYLVIGNFRNAMNSTLGYTPVPCPTTGFMTHCDAYYYIDDVSVKLSGGDIIDTTSLGLSTGLKEEGLALKVLWYILIRLKRICLLT